MEIFELLDKIRERPSLYLGTHSINRLISFLGGYYFYKHSCGISNSKQDKVWFMFQRWIEKKYSVQTSQSWAQIILFFSIDESKSLENFFILLEEFKNEHYHADND